MLCNPNTTPQVLADRTWLTAVLMAKRRVILPEIVDYEIRRELVRIQSHWVLTILDATEPSSNTSPYDRSDAP